MLIFYLILSAAADIVLGLYCFDISGFADIWKPLAAYPLLLIICLAVHLSAFIIFSVFADTKKRVTCVNNAHRRFLILTMELYFSLIRTKFTVRGKELIPKDEKFLLVCNHISSYDPMITMLVFKKSNLAFVAKKEALDIFAAGRYMHRAGCIPLNREDNREAVKAINAAAQNIIDGVCPMGIYPEGKVNHETDGLLPFRNGAFKIAKKAKVPILVTTIKNTPDINKNLFKRSTKVVLDIKKLINYEGIAELKTSEIGDMVHNLMCDNQ